MAIHLPTAKQIAATSAGHLNDGGGVVLRIEGQQGRWWFRYTSPAGQRRAMSLGVAVNVERKALLGQWSQHCAGKLQLTAKALPSAVVIRLAA